MKKQILMLCIVTLFTAVGCDKASDPDSLESLPEIPATVTLQTTTVTETTGSPTETETTMPAELPTETQPAETTETVPPATESVETNPQPSETAATTVTAEDDPYTGGDITGIWTFPDGYQMYFMENNTVELRLDYGGNMYFEDNVFHYYEEEYNVYVEGGTVTAMKDGETYLRMSATEQSDIETLSGRYYLEDCEFKAQYFAEEPGYFIDTAGTSLRIVAMAQYRTEGNQLMMTRNGSEIVSRYGVDGNELQIIDDEGYVDTLTRVN